MTPAVIDTDTLSYYSRGNQEVITKLNEYLEVFGYLNISVITHYEILNGLYFKDARRQLEKFEQILEKCKILDLTPQITMKSALIYAELRTKGLNIGHNDTLIAGTTIVNDMTLITNNKNHFSRIEGLNFETWI